MADHKMKKPREDAKTPICVPKFCQQPRSHGSKPRTDFSSLFFSTSSSSCCNSSSPNSGSFDLDLLSNKNNLSSITTTTTSNMNRHCQSLINRREETREFSLVKCDMLRNGGKGGIASDSSEIASSESESHHNRINVQSKCSDTTLHFCNPDKSTSQVTECSDFEATPGTILWAKMADQMWWPAKILDKRSAAANSEDDTPNGHILIQYYGNLEQAWVDPAGDLSEFDECFEERSCNPMEAFQEALKQALHKEDLEKSRSKWSESSSSKEEEGGRGKRKRKPKIHFDEVNTCRRSATKKMRRLRIMRFLGLTPPVGSPFHLPLPRV